MFNDLIKKWGKISQKREEHGAVGHDPLKHAVGELVEAVAAREAFYNLGLSGTGHDRLKSEYAGELADVLACVLIAAAQDDIDLDKALTDCTKRNEARALGVGDKL